MNRIPKILPNNSVGKKIEKEVFQRLPFFVTYCEDVEASPRQWRTEVVPEDSQGHFVRHSEHFFTGSAAIVAWRCVVRGLGAPLS